MLSLLSTGQILQGADYTQLRLTSTAAKDAQHLAGPAVACREEGKDPGAVTIWQRRASSDPGAIWSTLKPLHLSLWNHSHKGQNHSTQSIPRRKHRCVRTDTEWKRRIQSKDQQRGKIQSCAHQASCTWRPGNKPQGTEQNKNEVFGPFFALYKEVLKICVCGFFSLTRSLSHTRAHTWMEGVLPILKIRNFIRNNNNIQNIKQDFQNWVPIVRLLNPYSGIQKGAFRTWKHPTDFNGRYQPCK